MLSFRQLEIFRSVMVCGSISAAAQQMNIAQPTVTNTIKRLEDVLGVELFERSGGRLTPTRVAQQIFEVVQPSIVSMEQLSLTVKEIAGGRHVKFRLGVSPSVSQALAPRALRFLAEANPGVSLRMDTLSLKQIKDYLLLAEGDCAVTIFPVKDAFLVSQQIAEIALVCLVPIEHPLSQHASLSLADIASEPLIFFHPNTPHGKMLRDTFETLAVQPNIAIETRFAESAVNLIYEGFGIAVVDELTSRGVRQPDIKVVPLAGTPRLPVLLHHHKDHGSPRVLNMMRTCLIRAARDLDLL
jgi:DNA-binding transcriptional LysR family regulator